MAWLIGMPASWAWADEVPPPPPSTKSALKFAAESERLFQHYCAHCHGTHGEGDGYNSEFLEKDPADLTDIEFVSKKTNDQIFRTIHQGGAGIRKSHLMPVFGNTLSEEEIWGLVAHIRKLAGDDSHPLTLPLGVMKKARPEPISLTRGHVKAFLQWFLKEKSKDELVSWGRRLFEEKKSCFACHRVGDEGGKVGPDLTRAGFDYKPEWLFAWVQGPQNMKKKTKMPNLGLRTDEAIAITAFLSTLKGEVSEIPEEWGPYMETAGDPKRGEALFYDPDGKANCVKCHWILGKGGKVGANLSMVGSSRTLPFLLESILDPTAVITVGFSSMMVLTKEKKFITGIKKGEDDSSLTIFTKEGTLITIPCWSIRAHAAALFPILTKLFISTAFIWVRENFIRLTDFLKSRFSLSIARVHIRMVFASKFSIRTLNCITIGIALNTKHFEIVSVTTNCHKFPRPPQPL